MELTEQERSKDAAVVSLMYTAMTIGLALIIGTVILYLLGVDVNQIPIQNVLQGVAITSIVLILLIYNEVRKM